MICRLCLGEFAYLLNLFDEDAHALTKAQILQQHFWFELTPNDPVSTFICYECWHKVDDFHQFYKSVQATQTVLADSRFHEITLGTETIVDDSITTGNPMDVFIIKEEYTDEEFHANAYENQEMLQVPAGGELENGNQPLTEGGHEESFGDFNCKRLSENDRELIRKNSALIRKYIVMACELCLFVGDDFDEIVMHFRQDHPDTMPYVRCCGVKLKYSKVVLQHAQKHQDPEFFKYNVRQKVLASTDSFRNPKPTQHGSAENEIFECNQCLQRFSRRLLLNLHIASHVKEKQHTLRSDEVSQPMTFANDTQFNIHKAQKEKPSYVCQVCTQEFRFKTSYEKHVLRHSSFTSAMPYASPRVQCPIQDCNVTVAKMSNLKVHMLMSHEDTMFKCDKCGMMSKSAHALAVHKRRIHNLTTSHSCEICGKNFKRSTFLKEHKAMHAGVSLNSCRFCERTFTFQSNMYGHMRKMHKEEYDIWRRARQQNLDAHST